MFLMKNYILVWNFYDKILKMNCYYCKKKRKKSNYFNYFFFNMYSYGSC